MPLLGGLLVTLFSGLFEFFVAFFAREVALRLAFAALVVAGFATLYGVGVGLVSGIAYVMPAGLATVFAFVFPANVVSCVSAVLTVDGAVLAFRLYVTGMGK